MSTNETTGRDGGRKPGQGDNQRADFTTAEAEPQSPEAERAVLGSMLLNPDALSLVVPIVEADDFYSDKHQRIFGGMLTLFKRSSGIDLLTLKEELNGGGTETVDATYLSALLDGVPDIGNVEHYARIVKDRATARRLIRTGEQLVRDVQAGDESAAARALRSLEFSAAPSGGLHMVRAVDVDEEKIEWLWGGRIPKRSLVFISGDPGLGKSQLAGDVATRLSKGAMWPDSGTAEAGATLFLSSEDGFADVLRPRLRVAGADLSRIGFLTGKSKPDFPAVEFLLTLHEDLAAIEAALPAWTKELGLPIRLLVVDPFLNHLGVPGREDEVRPLLARLAAFLRRTGLAALGIRHLNKTAEKALLYRPGGLMAFTGAARAEYIVGKDPTDPERRVLASIKSNLAIEPGALAFQIVGSAEDPAISSLKWWGPTTVRAEDVISPSAEDRDGSQRKRAEAMLLDLLGEGQYVPAEEVFKKATELEIGRDSVYAAARTLEVIKRPMGFRKGWGWSLAEDQT